MTNKLTQELRFKLDSKCTNNQAEQFAILKALEIMKQHKIMEDRQKTVLIHTDSQITLDSITNQNNHNNLIKLIRNLMRELESKKWTIHFIWVKAHVGIWKMR